MEFDAILVHVANRVLSIYPDGDVRDDTEDATSINPGQVNHLVTCRHCGERHVIVVEPTEGSYLYRDAICVDGEGH